MVTHSKSVVKFEPCCILWRGVEVLGSWPDAVEDPDDVEKVLLRSIPRLTIVISSSMNLLEDVSDRPVLSRRTS